MTLSNKALEAKRSRTRLVSKAHLCSFTWSASSDTDVILQRLLICSVLNSSSEKGREDTIWSRWCFGTPPYVSDPFCLTSSSAPQICRSETVSHQHWEEHRLITSGWWRVCTPHHSSSTHTIQLFTNKCYEVNPLYTLYSTKTKVFRSTLYFKNQK